MQQQIKLLLSSSSGNTAKRYLTAQQTKSSSSFGRLFTSSNSASVSSSTSAANISTEHRQHHHHHQQQSQYQHQHNYQQISIRYKSSLHKKANQALNKKQIKNTIKKQKINNVHTKVAKSDGGGRSKQQLDGNDKHNVDASSNDNNNNNNMTVNDDILKEVQSIEKDTDTLHEDLNGDNSKNETETIYDSSASSASIAKELEVKPKPALHQGHLHEFAPKIVVVGVGGGGSNAVNNMILNQLSGVDFLALNTDAQHLSTILTDNRLQIGSSLTSGLGCGANPDAGRLAAEESREEISEILSDAHMVFITAGMGGGTGTGAAPVVAEVCYNLGILTVGVITKPFRFEGTHRMRLAKEGIDRLEKVVDTLIVIPNQNLFGMANDQTSFVDAFAMADNVLLAGVKSITDLMTTPGLINLDFADVQSVMHGMGNAMLGTGVSSTSELLADADGKISERAILAAEQALANPLLGENMDIGTAKGMLVNITGGNDMTLFEVDRAAQCITERIQDENANIIFGSAYDESLNGSIRVSVVATGIEEKLP